MGHEIVYCTRCASRIVGADFEKGKAFRLAGNAICSACVPTLTPEEQQSLTSTALPELKSSSSKMKTAKATGGTSVRMPQVDLAAPPEGSSKALLIGGGIAFAAAAVIAAVAMFSKPEPSHRDPEPPAPPVVIRPPKVAPPSEEKKEDAQLRDAREAVERARAKEKSSPDDLEGQVSAWEEATRKAALTPLFKDASTSLVAAREKLLARKPATPPPAVPPPPPVPAPATESTAYLAKWLPAAARATGRDFDGAIADLKRAASELAEESAKKAAAADADDLSRVKALQAEALEALSRLSRGYPVSLVYRTEGGESVRVEGSVVRAAPGHVEIRQGDGVAFVDASDVASGSLAAMLGPRPAADKRALALLCLLEGDRDSAEGLLGGETDSVAARYWTYAKEAAAKIPKPAPRDVEARKLFAAAEREFAKPDSLPAAVAKYRTLAQDYTSAAAVKGDLARIQKRADAGRDYVFLSGSLKGAGSFAPAAAPKVDAAWVSRADADGNAALENYVEAEFAALPDVTYRCWALVGACCAETFAFYVQVTEGTDLNPKTRQRQPIDPGSSLAALAKHSISGLKKNHAAHVPKMAKSPARWEWVSIPLPKYAAPGAKKVRILSEHQGFGVAAVIVSASRSTSPGEPEFKDDVTRARAAQAAAQEGLIGWWRLDETAGATASDAVESGHPATLKGSPKWTPGKVGGGLKFEGDADEAEALGAFAFQQVTLSAWVRHDSMGSKQQRYITVGDEMAVLRCNGDRTLHFYLKIDGQLVQMLVPNSLEVGKWTFVAGTWDGATQRLYKDGVLVSSHPQGGRLTGVASRIVLSAPGESMKGAIDEARVYDRALSEAEIRRQYAEATGTVIAEAPPPPETGKPWRPLFDGRTVGCLRENGAGWKAENGAIVMLPNGTDAAQTREEFEDCELRVRFETKDADRIWFHLRQGGGGGSSATFEGAVLKGMEGKTHELIFVAKGDQITATLDGKPTSVVNQGPAKRGCLQFRGSGKTVIIQSIDVR